MKISRVIRGNHFLDNLTIISFGFFPILPNSIKGLPVVLLILNSIIVVYKTKGFENQAIFKKRLGYTLLMTSVYICYLFSSFYSENHLDLGQKLETSLSLFLIPLCFMFVKNNKYLKHIHFFKTTFIVSTILFIVFFWTYYLFDYSTTSIFPLRTIEIRNKIDAIPTISLHPIYASMVFSISIFLLLSFWKKINNYIFFLTLMILVVNVLILASKMIIISLFFIIIFVFFKSKQNIYFKIITIFFTSFALIAAVLYVPNLRQRFDEIAVPTTYEKVIIWNSTSIRKGIYDCSIILLKNKWLVGYGVGDVQDNLNNCYEAKSDVLLKGKYNSHNQYLSIWLGTGIIGLLLFLFFLFYNFMLAWRFNDMLFQVLIIFFVFNFLTENLLQRQTGVILFSLLINLFGWSNFDKTVIVNFKKENAN